MFARLLMGTAAAIAAIGSSDIAAARAPHTMAAPASAGTPAKAAPPYNVVYILLDDLRFDAMGFLTRGLRTPNIDLLAKRGVYFPNAVVTSSLCSPSRATILTGMSMRNHGIIDNNDSSEAGLTFFPQLLQRAGYQTGFFGKWHMGRADDRPRPGFDRWVSFKGQGSYFPTGNLSTLNVDGKSVPRRGYITDELTDYAVDWLKHGRDPARPFFLYLSHKAVHQDPKPPQRYAGQYRDLPITLPASMANTPENNRGKPMWVRNQRNSWHGVDFMYNGDEPLTTYVRRYYETLSAVDDSVGRIMAVLKEQHHDRDTVVIFTSDNGFQTGDHGLIDKRDAYEPSIRVPFLIAAPGLLPQGVTNPGLIRNLDLAPTVLDIAGVAPAPQFEGRSFLPLAAGRIAPGDWKPGDFIYEYYWEWNFPETPTTFAIERDRVKYIQYQGVWDIEELYDLAHDPDEMHNLIDDPAWLDRKIALRAALYQGLADRNGRHVVPFSARAGRGVVERNVDGPPAAAFPPEWMSTPNRYDRYNGLFPDTKAKQDAIEKKQLYLPPGFLAGL